MAIFQPNDFAFPGGSGLFAWFQSSSITGIANGGNLSGWSDLSGSGNNLTNGGGSPVTYFTNQLNGFPTARFSGGSYMYCPVHNPSIEIAASSMSIYTVFLSRDPYAQQIVFANDRYLTTNENQDFIIGLNYNSPSSWYYGWGHSTSLIGINGFNYLTASPTGTNTAPLNQPNQFVIRSDIFSQTVPGFYFGNGQTSIAGSSLAGNHPDTNSLLRIGSSAIENLPFNGDVAEIIAYNFNLIDYNVSTPYYPPYTNCHQTVIEYLKQKYFLGGSFGCDLFITTGSGAGISGISNNTTLYTESATNITSGIKLYTENATLVNSGISLYTFSSGLYASNIPLWIGMAVTQNTPTTPLWIGAGTYISGHVPLFTTNNPMGNIPLWIGCGSYASSIMPLWIGDGLLGYNTTTLSISGTITVTGTLPFWTAGSYQQYPPMVLYTHGQQLNSGNISLFTGHGSYNNNDITLYMPTIGHASGVDYTLFINGKPPTSGNVNLYINGPNSLLGSGLYHSSPLFIQGSASGYNTHLPLFLNNLASSTPSPDWLPLFISGPIHTGIINNAISLYLGNYTQIANSRVGKLYTAGAGTLVGGKTYVESMPLFLNTTFGGSTNLFIHGSGQGRSFIPMFTSGTNFGEAGVLLYTTGLLNSGNIPLFIQAPLIVTSGIPMSISGKPYIQQGITFYENGW
jgi:hypothetical protein